VPRPPRVYQTAGIVLRQRRLGEVDKVITLYTANFGKVEAVAKGVRRVKSRLAGHVEPLNHASYLLAHGRNLDIITQAQTIETFQPLREDLGRLSRALYAAELVDRATEERAENFALYRLLLDALRRLARAGDLDLVLRHFEVALLDLLGYRPQLRECVSCRRAIEDGAVWWAPGLGGAVCDACHPPETPLNALSTNALRVLRLLQDGGFRDASRVELSPELSAEIERHVRAALHHALEREVRSAAFLDAVRRPRPARNAGGRPRTRL
jgi:DNA repair protein RecO (recombination protein O)